ncbi:MAG: hypothetical protein PHS62_00770 [Patescibacteria group bacterium]|nr:hypothetical protein [Patescibacteria group bacterium]
MADKITIDSLAGMMKKEFDIMGDRFDKVDQRFNKLEGRMEKIEATMVTKDYLDEKLADLRGDLVVLTRKEDNKVCKLIAVLKRRKVISEAEEKEILSMEPFAKMSV